jgi:glycerol uptake facilitator-like aquaporin
MAPDLGRRLLAEPIGPALFVVFGAGAVVAALRLGNGKLDYAAGLVIGLSEEAPAAAAAEQGTAGAVEGRRVAPGEAVPVGGRD